MSLLSTLFAISVAFAFIACIMYIIFGQVTVRKLRKNPETKDKLGFEFVSGWDIIKVAQALSLPRFMTDKFKQSPLSGLFADADILSEHTTRFDRVLARLFYWLYAISGFSMILLMLLDVTGLFDYIESLA
ncbi:hypothetical protein HWV01_14575 [Moritella sp. 5]|uniref:hypothetical protein n=1 Tax=Moritella sp. 5 TaxID=2746231 RepID=UPI001BA48CE2|nr:hypothetical protein [Moritella sp. 5]QUM81420.1 hypothetical protein HWV01_14575 [Moritella sp. 5]